MSKNGGKQSTIRLPELVHFPLCNKTNIHQYVRMPRDLPPTSPKVGMLSEVFKEEHVTVELTFPVIDT